MKASILLMKQNFRRDFLLFYSGAFPGYLYSVAAAFLKISYGNGVQALFQFNGFADFCHGVQAVVVDEHHDVDEQLPAVVAGEAQGVFPNRETFSPFR